MGRNWMPRKESEIVAKAEALGAWAHQQGRHRAPALHDALLDLMKANDGYQLTLMRAWLRAWDRSNLTRPQPLDMD